MWRRTRALSEWRRAVDATSPDAPKPPPLTFVTRYRTFCYRILGARFEGDDLQEELGERLRQAGVEVTPAMHRSVTVMTTVIATVTVAAVTTLLFGLALRAPEWYLYSGILT